MLVQCFVIVLALTVLVVLSIPIVLTILLKKVFRTVRMKLFSPFSLRGIFMNGQTEQWGLSQLTVFISSIEFGWSPDKFKLRLNLNNIQVYISRRIKSLYPVNLIDGKQQANILYNFINYLATNYGQQPLLKQPKNLLSLKQSRKIALTFFTEGVVHLMFILLMKTIEIVFNDCSVFVVSGIPQKSMKFQNDQQRKQSLMLMQCLSEYTVKCKQIKVVEIVQNHKVYNLTFMTQKIYANSYNNFKDHFVCLDDAKLEIIIPYSLSLAESFKQLNFAIHIKNAQLNLIPSDFDHFFQFVRQLIFSPFEKRNQQEKAINQQQIQLFVDNIKVHLRQIYEAEYDNRETKQYLSNVSGSTIWLQKICLSEKIFSVEMSTLLITKFGKQAENQQFKIVNIPKLMIITKPTEDIIEIQHEDVVINCQSEQIAFLGKIFTIINERIRFQNYNEEIYSDLQHNFIYGGTLISYMAKMLETNILNINLEEEVSQKRQQKMFYMPKKLTFYIQMKKLVHQITVDGFSYTRHHNFNEMSHEIIVSKILVQHKLIKQFAITEFKLTFSQTIAENQLSISVQDIKMAQNQETLIDYLDSFTLFKHLLQFQSDQLSKTTKLTKKYVIIEEICLDFGTQHITLKQLQIDKITNINHFLDTMYFSINKCEVVLQKMKGKQKDIKNSTSKSHTIFSIQSISLNLNFYQRHEKSKPRIMIIVKNPSFNFPALNISKRILFYFRMYIHMESHIQAYLKNVTNEKLKYEKYHIKDFLFEPPQLTVIITNFSLSICDTKLDSKILAFSKTIRDYFSAEPKYNQAQIINNLKRNNKSEFPLLNVKFEKIVLQIFPVKGLHPTAMSIDDWIKNFNENKSKPKDMPFDQERYRRIKAENFKLKFTQICANLRDYPSTILSMKSFLIGGQRVRIKKIFGKRMHYIMGQVIIDDMFISLGLGQLSGWQQIGKRISQYGVIKKHLKTQRQVNEQKEQLTILHKVMSQWDWKLGIQTNNTTKIQILTGDTPYTGQKFQFQLGKFRGHTETGEIVLTLDSLELALKEFSILSIPRLQIKLEVITVMNEFDIRVNLNIKEEQLKIRVASWILLYLQGLKQLKKDWLLIYGLYNKEMKKNLIEVQEIQHMSYLEIAELFSNQKDLQNFGKKSKSVLNYLNSIKLVCCINEISIGVIQRQLEMSLKALEVGSYLVIQPNHDLYNQLKVRRSRIVSKSINVCFAKTYSEVGFIIRPLDAVKLIKNYEFITCNDITLNFNWFFEDNSKIHLTNKWISAKDIKAEISKKMQRYCLQIFKQFKIEKTISKESPEIMAVKPISKFRRAVFEIIRINRRKKMQASHMIKFNWVVEIQNYKFTLNDEQNTMILYSLDKATFYHQLSYTEDDNFHSRPFQHITAILPSNKIKIVDTLYLENAEEIMNTGIFRLQIYKLQQTNKDEVDWGKCEFEKIDVKLSAGSKNILEKIIEFIVDLVNTDEHRRQLYKTETEKYSQLVNNQREKIEEKIKWNQSDLKWKEKLKFKWNFVFKQLSLSLEIKDKQILSAEIDRCEVSLRVFDNSKIERKITFKYMQIVNLLEPEDSEYRKILELGRQTTGLAIIVDTYEVKAFNNILWDYFRQVSLWIQPIRLRVTEQFLELFIEYLGRPNIKEQLPQYDELIEYSSKTPNYFRLLCIEPINLQLWFLSENIIKRMDGIKLHLLKYELKDKFYTKNELIRAYAIWLIKQVVSQTFSVLGQKILGDDEDDR